MSAIVEAAITALATTGFFVETAGGRYTVARGGETLLRQGTVHDLLIFTRGVAAGFDAGSELSRFAALEQQLENSPHHQAALKGEDK